MPHVEDFYTLMAAKLSAEADMAAKWLEEKHWGSVGASREAALRRFIAAYLPQRLACGTGFIVNEGRELSRQCDLLVYDRHALAPLFIEDDFAVVRADAVRLVIEVKSGVDAGVFREAVENVRAAKSLHPAIRGAIFGLTGPKTKQGLKGWLESIALHGVPGPPAAKDDNHPVPEEHLVDFAYFADGLQMHVVREEKAGCVVSVNQFEKGHGTALMWFWDWILSETKPLPALDARTAAPDVQWLLTDYLGLPKPERKKLLTYRNAYRAALGDRVNRIP